MSIYVLHVTRVHTENRDQLQEAILMSANYENKLNKLLFMRLGTMYTAGYRVPSRWLMFRTRVCNLT